MAFPKKGLFYFAEWYGDIHVPQNLKSSGNILKDFGKVCTITLKLINKKSLTNFDSPAPVVESLTIVYCWWAEIYVITKLYKFHSRCKFCTEHYIM